MRILILALVLTSCYTPRTYTQKAVITGVGKVRLVGKPTLITLPLGDTINVIRWY